MTTFVSLPLAVFANPAASILLPIALGGAVGYGAKPNEKDPAVRALKHPPLRPPPGAFPPIWAGLYGLMGYAAHRALGGDNASGPHAQLGATLYTVQLGLNLAWMPLFYTLRQGVAATADAVVLVGLNTYLAALWIRHVDRVAGWLLVPYVAWLGFAAYLSAGTSYLNGWFWAPKKEEKKE